MKPTPEMLMAYADGELDTDTRRQIEFAMATDTQVAEQVARLKAQRLEVQAAFAAMLDEPVPDRLVETAQSATAADRSEGVAIADLASRRAKKREAGRRRWSWREFASIAATLLIGLVLGRNVLQQDELIVAQDGRLAADDILATALSQQTGGHRADGVTMGLTFKSKSGEYCRTFSVSGKATLAGLACRDAGGWRIDAVAATGGAESRAYRMAGAEMPAPLLRAVEDAMAGEALDEEAEAEAMRAGWR